MNCILKKSYTRASNNPQSAMRNFSSCFGKYSIKLTAAAGGNTSTITSIFKTRLSSGKPLIIKLTWYMIQADPSLFIGVDDNPDFNNPWKSTSMNYELLRKRKGTLSFLTSTSSGSLHWDFSAARYQQGPEPTENFYFAIIIDDEIALLLGDNSGEFLKRSNENFPIAEFSLLCRREEVVGRSLNSITRAKFGEAGKDHEISIRCREGGWDGKEAELLVSIDKKRVLHVVKLNWNFRGNETIFVDGLPVDMMWDMHGWWFGSLAGHAVFLFRQRRKLETRLWLEEKETPGFSLLIPSGSLYDL